MAGNVVVGSETYKWVLNDTVTVEQIRRVFDDNFGQFSIKTYVVGTH